MILQLIKTVVKNTLHQAAEEWAEEFGLPEGEVLQLRERRLAAVEKELRGLHELMQVNVEPDVGALGTENDVDFFQWVHDQRQGNVTWANIATEAAAKGQELSESALRKRYQRWCEQNL